MAEKSLSYFMRESAKQQEIVEIPGVASIKDEKGNIVPFKVKILNNKEINEIYDKYRTKTIAVDKKGNPIVKNGQVVFKVDADANTALRRVLVEALVYPDLHNQALIDFYDCIDLSDMLLKVLPNPKEYEQIQDSIMIILGLKDDPAEEDEVKEAKN